MRPMHPNDVKSREELEAENDRLRAALEPFGRNAKAKSLSDALGHITREDLLHAQALSGSPVPQAWIAITGIWLDVHEGKIVVRAEIDGEWRKVISKNDHGGRHISHIVESSEILKSKRAVGGP